MQETLVRPSSTVESESLMFLVNKMVRIEDLTENKIVSFFTNPAQSAKSLQHCAFYCKRWIEISI